MLVFHPRLEQRQNVENPKWEWGKQELGEGEFIWPIESAVKRLYGIRQLGASYNHLILRRGNKRKLRGNRADFWGGATRRARAVCAIP